MEADGNPKDAGVAQRRRQHASEHGSDRCDQLGSRVGDSNPHGEIAPATELEHQILRRHLESAHSHAQSQIDRDEPVAVVDGHQAEGRRDPDRERQQEDETEASAVRQQSPRQISHALGQDEGRRQLSQVAPGQLEFVDRVDHVERHGHATDGRQGPGDEIGREGAVAAKQRGQFAEPLSDPGALQHVGRLGLAYEEQHDQPDRGQTEGQQERGAIAVAEDVALDQIMTCIERHTHRREPRQGIAQTHQQPPDLDGNHLRHQEIEDDALDAQKDAEQTEKHAGADQGPRVRQQQTTQGESQDLDPHQYADHEPDR